MTMLQAQGLRVLLRGFEVGRTLRTSLAILIAVGAARARLPTASGTALD